MASFGGRCNRALLVTLVVCCLSTVVSSNQDQARNYQNFINSVRALLSHPYRDNTAVVTGGQGVSFMPLNPLAGGDTTAELILSHRDLYVQGYRVRQNGQRVVYLLQDVQDGVVNQADYDRLERLNFGGSYGALERYSGRSRPEVEVNANTLRDGIHLLEELPNRNTERQRGEIVLALVMVVSEAARFNEIFTAVQERLLNGGTWRATTRDTGLMNSWGDLSAFVVRNSQDVTEAHTEYFSNLNEQLTVRAALALMAVMARCFQRHNRKRQTTPAECGVATGVEAALADGVNNVYLFNGPNFAHIQFTPGTKDDRILDGIKSIYNDWSFLRGTEFVKGLDAGFRVPNSNNAYIFKGNNYALIDVSSKRIINGPKTIWDSWPSLRPTVFANGIDAAFASIRKDEVYIFRGDQYALVNYAPGTTDDWIVNGPKSIYSSWPSLRNTAFQQGFDAAFARPDKSEAYLFKGSQYVLIDYAPGTSDDRIINGPLKIRDGWPSLQNTAFDV